MKQLLPVAASNLLTSSFETFRKNCKKDSRSFCLEGSITPSDSCDEKMNSVGQEHRVCFKMPYNGHYYIGLTAYSFRDFICERLGDVYDWYVLFSQSLHEYFKRFQSLSRPDFIYESDEEFGLFHNDQPAPDLHDDRDHSNFNDIGMIDLDDSDGPE